MAATNPLRPVAVKTLIRPVCPEVLNINLAQNCPNSQFVKILVMHSVISFANQIVTWESARLSLHVETKIKMKTNRPGLFVLVAVAVMVCFFAHRSSAQGNFDPAQFRERQLERYRERIEVKSDEDWKKLEPLIGKVMDAQREARMGMGFGGFGGRGGGGARGGGGGNGNQGGNLNRAGGQRIPEATELQKALDDKASAEEVKAKVAKFRDARKVKEAELEKAQGALRKALSPRQEAGAVLVGLLK